METTEIEFDYELTLEMGMRVYRTTNPTAALKFEAMFQPKFIVNDEVIWIFFVN